MSQFIWFFPLHFICSCFWLEVPALYLYECDSDKVACVSKLQAWSINCTNKSSLVLGGVYQGKKSTRNVLLFMLTCSCAVLWAWGSSTWPVAIPRPRPLPPRVALPLSSLTWWCASNPQIPKWFQKTLYTFSFLFVCLFVSLFPQFKTSPHLLQLFEWMLSCWFAIKRNVLWTMKLIWLSILMRLIR